MRYRLRTLLIVLAILPPLLWVGWTECEAWKAEQERCAYLRVVQPVQIPLIIDEVVTAWQLDLREFSEPPATPMQPPESTGLSGPHR